VRACLHLFFLYLELSSVVGRRLLINSLARGFFSVVFFARWQFLHGAYVAGWLMSYGPTVAFYLKLLWSSLSSLNEHMDRSLESFYFSKGVCVIEIDCGYPQSFCFGEPGHE